MKKSGILVAMIASFIFCGTGFAKPAGPAVQVKLSKTYGEIPLAFEINRGQTDEQVKFLSRGSGYTLYLTPTETVLVLSKAQDKTQEKTETNTITPGQKSAVIRMKLAGANASPEVSGLDKLPGTSNYFVGKNPAKWRGGVARYKKVWYEEVYPGIDLVYYGKQTKLEYDFVVAPGADPKVIALVFQGTEKLTLDSKGNLVLHTAVGEALLKAPIIYQEIEGARKTIDGKYLLQAGNRVAFQVSAYDTAKPLIIDPILEYATYLGGTGFFDGVGGIDVDATGAAYVTGFTSSTDFPTAGPVGVDTSYNGGLDDAFISKLSPDGSFLVYSTYLGGSGLDGGNGIVADTDGAVYVVGNTSSPNFPTTAGAVQEVPGGGHDGFITKLSPDGSALVYSTYLGGSVFDGGREIAVDGSGAAYVTGQTKSSDFPVTTGAVQEVFGGDADGFVTKLSPDGSSLVYSTHLGGSDSDGGFDIAVDESDAAYVTGETKSSDFPTTAGAVQNDFGGGDDDAFISKVSPDGATLDFSTYLGGSDFDFSSDIAVDESGAAFVTGRTRSSNFPTTAGAAQEVLGGGDDVFVTKLNPNGSDLLYSTYLGGSEDDGARGIAVDAYGNAYTTGNTGSSDFPITAGAVQPSFGGGPEDAFISKLSPNGSTLDFSTYLGGSHLDFGSDIAVDGSGGIYVMGQTFSSDFPVTAGAFQTTANAGGFDAFISKIQQSLSITDAEVVLGDPLSGRDQFILKGVLTLSLSGNGIDLTTDDVTVTFEGFSEIILAGSFVRDAPGLRFVFEGLPGASGIKVMELRDDGRFKIRAKRIDLTGIDLAQPLLFSLKIDDDFSETNINLVDP